MSRAPRSILFVCLGNVCRSPLAEMAMRSVAREAGLDLEMDKMVSLLERRLEVPGVTGASTTDATEGE